MPNHSGAAVRKNDIFPSGPGYPPCHPTGNIGLAFRVVERYCSGSGSSGMAIVKIRHKGLRDLFEKGRTAKVGKDLQANALLIMDHLDAITTLEDCAGVKDFHELKGSRKGEYSMHVSGNWCITFTFDGTDATILNLEDYHR